MVEPTVASSLIGEMTVAVVEGSSSVRVVEEVVPAEATAITGVVVEAEAKLAHDAAEASGQGDGSMVHRAGKEVVADVPPGLQGGEAADTANIEEEGECEFFDHSFEFFIPPRCRISCV